MHAREVLRRFATCVVALVVALSVPPRAARTGLSPRRAGVADSRAAGEEVLLTTPSVIVPGPRGALRALTSDGYADLVLVPVTGAGASQRRLRPDFRGPGCVEFYGIETSTYHAFLEAAGRASAPTTVTVQDATISVARFGPLSSSEGLDFSVLRDGQLLRESATILASYPGLDLLLPWRGDTCRLPAPFGTPTRIAVRLHYEGPRVMMGVAGPPRTERGRLVIDLNAGRHRIACQPVAAPSGVSDVFEVAWRAPVSSRHVSCARAGDTQWPPRAHTIANGAADDPLIIDSIPEGSHLVGVGGRGVGAYTLWRTVAVRAADHAVALVPPTAGHQSSAGNDAIEWAPYAAPAAGQAVVVVINRATNRAVDVRLGRCSFQVPGPRMQAFAIAAPVEACATLSESGVAQDECNARLQAGDVLTVEYD